MGGKNVKKMSNYKQIVSSFKIMLFPVCEHITNDASMVSTSTVQL